MVMAAWTIAKANIVQAVSFIDFYD